jgi:hypothetical protein
LKWSISSSTIEALARAQGALPLGRQPAVGFAPVQQSGQAVGDGQLLHLGQQRVLRVLPMQEQLVAEEGDEQHDHHEHPVENPHGLAQRIELTCASARPVVA